MGFFFTGNEEKGSGKMIKHYCSEQNRITEIESPGEDCWISLVNPTEAEVAAMVNQYGIDADAMRSALDTDERSRIETDENYTMVLVNIPNIETHNDKELYDTIPLSIFVVKKAVITVSLEKTPILEAFANGTVRDFNPAMRSRFVLQILYRTSSLFLQYLRSIDRQSEIVENKLHKSTQNRELIELLKLEKSLVYFTTALRSNEVVLEKLFKNDNIKKYQEDEELLEDVIVENKQAIEMANIYSGILSGMMDAFASVISNNLNVVMKVLAIITAVLSVPTMIFSAYGMNVAAKGMPFAESPYGFVIIVLIAVVCSLIVALIFAKTKMFK